MFTKHHITPLAITLLLAACGPLTADTFDPLDTPRPVDSDGYSSSGAELDTSDASTGTRDTTGTPTTGDTTGCTVTPQYLAPDSTMCTENTCFAARPYMRAQHTCTATELVAEVAAQQLMLHNGQSDTWSPAAIVMEATGDCAILMWGLQYRASHFVLSHGESFAADDVIADYTTIAGYTPGAHHAVVTDGGPWTVAPLPVNFPACD